MDWELYAFICKSLLGFGKFRFGFVSIVETVLTVIQLDTFPLVTIGSQCFFDQSAKFLAIGLYESWRNKEITDSWLGCIFSVDLS